MTAAGRAAASLWGVEFAACFVALLTLQQQLRPLQPLGGVGRRRRSLELLYIIFLNAYVFRVFKNQGAIYFSSKGLLETKS